LTNRVLILINFSVTQFFFLYYMSRYPLSRVCLHCRNVSLCKRLYTLAPRRRLLNPRPHRDSDQTVSSAEIVSSTPEFVTLYRRMKHSRVMCQSSVALRRHPPPIITLMLLQKGKFNVYDELKNDEKKIFDQVRRCALLLCAFRAIHPTHIVQISSTILNTDVCSYLSPYTGQFRSRLADCPKKYTSDLTLVYVFDYSRRSSLFFFC
jgi:hypothetical protein